MPTQQGFLHSSGKALAGRLERSIEAGRQHLAQCLRVKREESAVTNSSLAGKVALVTGAGSIVHIASQPGRVAAPQRVAYCSTKGAVIQLAKAMAIDHAGDNVRVNALSPGAVATRRMIHRYGGMDEARRTAGPKHLLNRLGEPDEIAQAALFLASDGASFMTGADLLVDGGYTAV